ncbi:gfo/Idh/MocA family oxidoreductase [Larkinella knui]|uniref:Gfo/Idh/MocA family oxidoreductase n=1 Tax=Larkinella knui TaxID=2025310 RepID=A0A3P1CR07_9BACT|nr:gfo/Idh/MocA family oxidoreductase [Larkinella knui]
MIRWGVLGLGRIAHKFVQDLQTVPNVELLAVASTSQQRADEFAARYGAKYAYGSYEALITCEGLDVVYIATTHNHHFENTMLCLNAGVAVLCEKPFAMNADQVRQMVETARSKQVFLMEALWTRFMPSIQKALELAENQSIGRVTGLRADFGFIAPVVPEKRMYNKSLGGGSLMDIGIYPLFLSYVFLGKPQTVKATAVFGSTGVDEQCGMVLTYAENQLAVLNSTVVSKTETDAVVYGETGNLYLPGRFHEGDSVVHKPGEDEPQTFTFARTTWGYDYEAEHVSDCLRQNKTESPLWSLDDSLNLIGLLDAVRAEAGIVYDEDK